MFLSFDADEPFSSNRPTYPHKAGYEIFSPSIPQSLMVLAIRLNPDTDVDAARPEIRSGHARDGGESGTQLRWCQRRRRPAHAPRPCDALASPVPQGLSRWSRAWFASGSIVSLRPKSVIERHGESYGRAGHTPHNIALVMPHQQVGSLGRWQAGFARGPTFFFSPHISAGTDASEAQGQAPPQTAEPIPI